MPRTRSITFLAGATALVVAALAVAGCGGSSDSNANSPAPPKNANGQGVNAFGGLWYVLSSSGDEITTPVASGGGFGY